ncbi:hypothetical protein GEMRC1_011321 [Eukaryota sp. GEM-RC1]
MVHSSSVRLCIGDLVRVRQDISTPRFRWGNVTHSSLGIVAKIEEAKCKVDFPSHKNWAALCSELEVVPWRFITGDVVRVRSELRSPAFGWQGGFVGVPGVVETVEEGSDRQVLFIRFPTIDGPLRF